MLNRTLGLLDKWKGGNEHHHRPCPPKKGHEFASQREITPYTSTGIKSYGSIVFISIQLYEIEIRLGVYRYRLFQMWSGLNSATNKILIKR